jgi:hypothetical protein
MHARAASPDVFIYVIFQQNTHQLSTELIITTTICFLIWFLQALFLFLFSSRFKIQLCLFISLLVKYPCIAWAQKTTSHQYVRSTFPIKPSQAYFCSISRSLLWAIMQFYSLGCLMGTCYRNLAPQLIMFLGINLANLYAKYKLRPTLCHNNPNPLESS